ncbi:hypothetical protein CLCR_06295 [Cladophialophora carrionii]|uniref:Uncharacterized protein n=1 Tax=Cladophialophora carrionii TaxID=86049 RepID=A0A1C1C7H2_9EURO|nr:hypothetical protein CLCR_06295 [Cladophialophora carrionii]
MTSLKVEIVISVSGNGEVEPPNGTGENGRASRLSSLSTDHPLVNTTNEYFLAQHQQYEENQDQDQQRHPRFQSVLTPLRDAGKDVNMSIAGKPKREAQASTRGPHGEDVVGMMPFSPHGGAPHRHQQHDGDKDPLAEEIEELVRLARAEAAGAVEDPGHPASQVVHGGQRK